jgi:UPF0716 family protein affecting phage T7 exclusion
MELTPFLIFVLPALTVLLVGMLGSTRRIGFWPALLLAILLTPVCGFVVTLFSGPKTLKPRRR